MPAAIRRPGRVGKEREGFGTKMAESHMNFSRRGVFVLEAGQLEPAHQWLHARP
jgi:hypothetical protein